MWKEELWWFIVALAVEIIAIGVGLVISPIYGWLIAAIGSVLLIIALWRIWGANRHKNKILKDLASFILEGEAIRDRCYNQKEPVPESEALSWAEKVATYLDGLGSHYRPAFRNSDGLGDAKIPSMYSREHQRVALFISYRLMRIQEFLAELRQHQ